VTLGTIQLLYKEYQAEGEPAESAPLEDESATSAFFDRVANRLAADGITMRRYGSWMYGGTVPFTAEGRVYLSLNRRHAEAIYRYLHDTVEAGSGTRAGRSNTRSPATRKVTDVRIRASSISKFKTKKRSTASCAG
jgi:hypothetical protein